MDWDRERRAGTAEAVLCAAKSATNIAAIIAAARTAHRGLLLTRLDAGTFAELGATVQDQLDYDAESRTAILSGPAVERSQSGCVGIVTAGSSDLPVALEARRTL